MPYPSFLQVFPRTTFRPRNGRIIRTGVTGASFVHTMHHARDRDFEVYHVLDPTQRGTLDAYYATNAALPFTFPHANLGNITCRFDGPPQYETIELCDLQDALVRLVEVDGAIEPVGGGAPYDFPTLTHLVGSNFRRLSDSQRALSPGGRAFVKANIPGSLIVGEFSLFLEITAAERTTLDTHYDDHELVTFEYDCPFRGGETWECVWSSEPQYDEINPEGNHYEALATLLAIRQP